MARSARSPKAIERLVQKIMGFYIQGLKCRGALGMTTPIRLAKKPAQEIKIVAYLAIECLPQKHGAR